MARQTGDGGGEAPKKGGRPSSYRPEYAALAHNCALLGATDKDLAGFFGVDERTVNDWKTSHPEFFQSLKAGKLEADAKVAESLYRLACGYSHPEERIFIHDGKIIRAETTRHYPPNPAACIFWLKNRQPQLWRERVEVKQEVDVNVIPWDELREIEERKLAEFRAKEREIIEGRAERLGLDLKGYGGRRRQQDEDEEQ